jgi:hypothetical protein
MILPGLQFGSGVVLGAPQTSSGNPAPNPTPLGFGVTQNVKMTLGAEIKTLFGQSQWAVDSAVGKRSIKGTVEFAQISNALMSQLFFGDGVTAGSQFTSTYPGEAHSVPASSTYTVTVTNAESPIVDFGVTYALTGVPLQKVSALTAAGQYEVNLATGVYTFDVADASAAVLVNYQYPMVSSGTTLTVGTHPMGYGPVVEMNLVFPYEGGGLGFIIPNARLGKIDIATKLDDYAMYTVDFEGFAGAAGVPFISYQAF